MSLLIAGLVIFLGIHSIRIVAEGRRQALITRFGEHGYKGLYTVVSLVQKIERSFNMIWHVPEMRSVAQRFSNYLSVIMVGPLLMVSAIGVSATIFSSSFVQTLIAIEPFGSVILAASRFTPFFRHPSYIL